MEYWDKSPLVEREASPSGAFQGFPAVCIRKYRRFNYPRAGEIVQEELKEGLEEKGIKVPEQLYRIPEFGVKTSYAEVAKYWEPNQCDYDAHRWRQAAEIVGVLVKSHVKIAVPIMSTDEAKIRIVQGTSCGWPLNVQWRSKGEAIADPEFWKIYSDYRASMLTDNPIPAFYQNSQKFEIRKVGKPARTFMTGSLLSHLLSLEIYGNLLTKLNSFHDRRYWPLAMGSSPFYGGWERLYWKIKKDVHVGTDVSGWDRSILPFMLESAMKVLDSNIKHSAESKKLAENLNYQLIFGLVVLENGEVVQKWRGMPSGDYRTITVNSIANWMKNIYCLLKMMPKEKLDQMEGGEVVKLLTESVQFSITGDDDLWGIDEKMFPWFDGSKMRPLCAGLGLLLKLLNESRNLCEIEYLSAMFFEKHGRILLLANREKLACQVVFGSQSKHPRVNAMRLLALKKNAWPDEEMFAAISCVAARYLVNHQRDIENDPSGDGGAYAELTWLVIMSTNMDDNGIEFLHLGRNESKESKQLPIHDRCRFGGSCAAKGCLKSVESLKWDQGGYWNNGEWVYLHYVPECYVPDKPLVGIEENPGDKRKQTVASNYQPFLLRTRGKQMPSKGTKKRVAKEYSRLLKDRAKGKKKPTPKKFKKMSGVAKGNSYKTKSFSAPLSRGYSTSVNRTEKPTIVDREEYIDTVEGKSDGSFNMWQAMNINPGLPYNAAAVFPTSVTASENSGFSSQVYKIAQLYEKYELMGLSVEMKSQVPATFSGSWGITFISDPTQALPVAGQELNFFMNHSGTITANVWKDISYRVDQKVLMEIKKKREFLRVRHGTPPGFQDGATVLASAFDLGTYDVGRFVIWTHGLNGAGNIKCGQVRLKCRVMFKDAKSELPVGAVTPPVVSVAKAAYVLVESDSSAVMPTGLLANEAYQLTNSPGLAPVVYSSPFNTVPVTVTAVADAKCSWPHIRIALPNTRADYMVVVRVMDRTGAGVNSGNVLTWTTVGPQPGGVAPVIGPALNSATPGVTYEIDTTAPGSVAPDPWMADVSTGTTWLGNGDNPALAKSEWMAPGGFVYPSAYYAGGVQFQAAQSSTLTASVQCGPGTNVVDLKAQYGLNGYMYVVSQNVHLAGGTTMYYRTGVEICVFEVPLIFGKSAKVGKDMRENKTPLDEKWVWAKSDEERKKLARSFDAKATRTAADGIDLKSRGQERALEPTRLEKDRVMVNTEMDEEYVAVSPTKKRKTSTESLVNVLLPRSAAEAALGSSQRSSSVPKKENK
jgi:hypothetical protein